MAFGLKISSQALRDLKEIESYTQPDAMPPGSEFNERLLDRAQSLTTFPYRHGSVAGRLNIRKVPFHSYIIFYKIHDDERVVEILRFWHAARNQRRLRLKEETPATYEAAKVEA
jgi:addiction module RelE/StbE family toxin